MGGNIVSRRNLFASMLMACLLVLGIGAATSYFGDPRKATGSGDTVSFSLSRSGSDGEMLASLKDYARSIGTEEPASMAAAGKLLPDVNTMIEVITARLQTPPEDIKGGPEVGWALLPPQRHKEGDTAFARAVDL